MIAQWFYSFWPCLVVGILVPIAAITLVQIVSKTIALKPIQLGKPKLDMLIAFGLFAFSVATVYFGPINLLYYLSPFLSQLGLPVFLEKIMGACIWLLFWLAIIGIILWARKHGIETIGLTGTNLKLCILMGFSASAPFLLANASLGLWQGPQYILFFFIMGGLAEEIIYRGFFQMRLASYFGDLKGFILASSLFVIIHIPLWIVPAHSVELSPGMVMLLWWSVFVCYLFGWMFYKMA
jgi:membrane protease YdiL (CAAX protease family)